MTHRRSRARWQGALVLAGVAIAMARPGLVDAKPLCLSNSVNASEIVLSTARLKKGKVRALLGYVRDVASAAPVSGLAVVGADGRHLAISLEQPQSSVGSSGVGISTASVVFRMGFFVPDGTLDVGDSSDLGLLNSAVATYTVVDCATAPPIP